MQSIRIDQEVWNWLKSHARPLEDSPNSVLRRIAGLDEVESSSSNDVLPQKENPGQGSGRRGGIRQMSGLRGSKLNVEWGVHAAHALFHKGGTFYNHLQYFPGAFFDPDGYLVFPTKESYEASPYLQHGKQVHVPGGLSSVPGYIRKR